MIITARKIPIIRYALIVSLIVILFITTFCLYLYYRKAEKVRYNVGQMILARESAAMIDSCLVNLYSADNNSRLYVLTADAKYFNRFSNEINSVDRLIGQLNNKNRFAALSGRNFNHLKAVKADKMKSYMKLNLLSDSLLKSAGEINIIIQQENNQSVKIPAVRKISREIIIDTVKEVVKPVRKKKLFGRIFEAFSAKKSDSAVRQQQKSPVVIRKTIATSIVTTPVIAKKVRTYRKNYQRLSKTNDDLKQAEMEILRINNNLINQIIINLKKYKSAEQYNISSGRDQLNDGLQDVVFKFRKLSSLIFFFLLSLVIIIFYNIWKIFRNEKEILHYGESAEQYALAKSAFLASMSHEIRTPLNSIIGFSEQLSQSQLNDVQKEQLSAISSSSKLLLEVVNEILDFSKFETGKMNFDPVPFLLYPTLEEVFNSLKIQADIKGIKLEKELNFNQDICLSGDCFRLKQVILNLLSNAIKFTAEGKVILKSSVTDGEKGMKILHVEVKDSGIGITKENLSLVFSEFSQVASAQHNASQKGTGLGLAISKKIVELQGGKIGVSSEAGKGSVFSFQLPFEKSDAESCKKSDLSDHTIRNQNLNGIHVLIAEDNKLNVLLLTTILKKWKITFDTAYDGNEAFLLFEKNEYDIVLSDIEMPEMGGVELAKLIRSFDDNKKSVVPILALTANVLKEDRDKYLEAGIDGVILKPFSEKDLLDNIMSVLRLEALN